MYYQRQSTPNLTSNSNNITMNSKLKSISFDSRCMYPKLKDFIDNDIINNDIDCNNNNHNSKDDSNNNNNCNNHDKININDKNNNIPNAASIIAAANALKDEFGLTLFGFDVIIPNKKNHNNNYHIDYNNCINDDIGNDDLVIIDVNFFPSYKEVIIIYKLTYNHNDNLIILY